jgi:hypothetical protein
LAYLAGQLNISARGAASEAMTAFILSVIDVAFRFADDHPHAVRDPRQLFKSPSRAEIANELITGAKALVARQLSGMTTCALTLQMDAGTIYHHHFLNYVVSSPGQTPFLVRSEFRDSFDQFAYAQITSDVISELASHRVSVVSVVADNLVAQQVGLRRMVNESDDPAIKQLVICPCANHTVNLVFQSEIKENALLRTHLGLFREFQHILRSRSAIRQYGKMCPDFPETRWFYICEVLRWIIDEAREGPLETWLMGCIVEGNEISIALRQLPESEFCDGSVPKWIDKLHSVLSVLEGLSLKFESRHCSLWMIVPLVEAAKSDLLRKADEEELEWIQELSLSLARKLTARFRQTFNYEAAIAAFLLSSEGRMKYMYRGNPPRNTVQGWTSQEAALRLTAEQLLEREKMKAHCDDLETKDTVGKEDLIREEMAKLLVTELQGSGENVYTESNTDIHGLREIGIADLGEDLSRVQDPDQVPDYDITYYAENAPVSYKEELRKLKELSREQLGSETVFKDMATTASRYLRDFASQFEFSEKDRVVRDCLVQWLRKDVPLCTDFLNQSPEDLWSLVEAEGWTDFAELARRLVGITPSESEVERTISTQRSIMGMRGTQFGQHVFTARTQIHQIEPSVLFKMPK